MSKGGAVTTEIFHIVEYITLNYNTVKINKYYEIKRGNVTVTGIRYSQQAKLI